MKNNIYYRLIATWVLCEAMLGGIIHGFKLPVSGLIVGSSAIVCICLIAWYVPQKGAIIKATIIVAIFKMMLSPQAPPPAYIAVFFQGLLGELLFFNRRFFRLSCILLAVLGLLESGLQRILVLTILYGNDGWKAINSFLNGLTNNTNKTNNTNWSLLIGCGYVLLHLLTGLFVGWWASVLPKRIESWSRNKEWIIKPGASSAIVLPAASKKRKRLKISLFIIWILLIGLYVQSYFKIGQPLLPPHISLKIFLRSIIIVLFWVFIIGPLLKKVLHNWLKKKQGRSQKDVQEVVGLLPATQELFSQSWKRSAIYKGRKRLNLFVKVVLTNTLTPLSIRRGVGGEVYVLTASIQTGKTTSLLNWSANRNDVYGILTPVVDGKRVFMDIHTREQFPMEAVEGEIELLKVGRFAFSKNNFEKAIQIIRHARENEGWLVMDEIGPMELKGEGFSEILKEITATRKEKLLLVVREGLTEKVKEYFSLNETTIISKGNLEQI